jgi:antitoxin component HigA of HigAB toxin-antitoxin module
VATVAVYAVILVYQLNLDLKRLLTQRRARAIKIHLLVLLVEAYEDKVYPIELPDPIAALRGD